MMFDSVSEAVSFAEEILSRPVITGAMHALTKQPGRGGDPDLVRDMAHTISNVLAQVEQSEAEAAGKVFRYVFGAGDNEQLMRATMSVSRIILADELRSVSVPDYQLRSMVLACLKQSRNVEHGRGVRSYAWVGRELGFTDAKKFRRKHRELVSHVREVIEHCLDIAEYRMEPALKDAGYLPV